MTFIKNKPKPQAVTEAGVYPTQAAAPRLGGKPGVRRGAAGPCRRAGARWAVRVVRI